MPTPDQIEVFDEARKLYPGGKRGLPPELKNFKKKYRDWVQIVPLLMPAIKKQIAWRDTSDWRPRWKEFVTWINTAWWTWEPPEEEDKIKVIPNKYCYKCHRPAERHAGGDYDNYLCERC